MYYSLTLTCASLVGLSSVRKDCPISSTHELTYQYNFLTLHVCENDVQ